MMRALQPGRLGRALLRIGATAVLGGVLCAAMVRFSPGFGVDENQLDPRLSAETRQALRQSYSLGYSQSLGRPIRDLLIERAPVTAGLMAYGIAGAWLLASILAVPALAYRLPRLGAFCNVLSGSSAALPAAGIALLLFRFGGPVKWTIALILFPRIHQFLRNLLAQSYAMPHVMLARAKGLGRFRILLHHVLPPAGPQLLALAAVSVNMAFGAAVAVEAICDLPGIGQLVWKAALSRDLPVLVVVTVLVTVLTQVAQALSLPSPHSCEDADAGRPA
ncbi:MAG TPA: ABC transporter permease [Bryobacteraceae bacterium]|jgi:ABC-type dipeptide/oligopeptide/nickel transport system permease component